MAGITITGVMRLWTLLLTLIVLVRVPLWLCQVMDVLGFIGSAWNVSVQTYRMQITPNELLGRTSSVALQIAWGIIPLGSLLAGVPAAGRVGDGCDNRGRRRDGGYGHRGHRARAGTRRGPGRPAERPGGVRGPACAAGASSGRRR